MARKRTTLWLALWVLTGIAGIPRANAQPPTNWMQNGPTPQNRAPQATRRAAYQATLGSGVSNEPGGNLFSAPLGGGVMRDSGPLSDDDYGTEPGLESKGAAKSPANSVMSDDPEAVLTPVPDGGWQDDGGPIFEPPAPLCSSGELINRGCWYTQLDAMYLSRGGPKPFTLGAEVVQNSNGQILNIAPLRTPLALGFEPGARATLGKFLGRDDKNRDYTLEITYQGGFDYFYERALNAQNFLIVSAYRGSPPGFNFATTQRFAYGSDLNSVEANFRISRRLGRDRMEFNPCTGDWVRKSPTAPLPTLFMGFRGIGVEEGFGYFSQGERNVTPVVDPPNPAVNVPVSGNYNIKTHNYMFGPQIGADVTWQSALWKFGVRVKGGGLVNFTDQHSDISGVNAFVGQTGNTGTPFALQSQRSSNTLAFVGEVNLTGAYYLRPNVAIRGSTDLMWINNVALASEQINFLDPLPIIINGGALFYGGGSLGLEVVW